MICVFEIQWFGTDVSLVYSRNFVSVFNIFTFLNSISKNSLFLVTASCQVRQALTSLRNNI